MTVSVTIDSKQIAAVKAAIEGTARSLRKELVIACNTAASKTKNYMAKQISQELNLPAKYTKRALKQDRGATELNIQTAVEIKKEKRFNLTSFGAKQVSSGVAYKVMRKGPKRIAKGAFQVDKWGGRTFRRVGKARGPLVSLKGPSPWAVFMSRGRLDDSRAFAEAELLKQVNRRIRFLNLKKAGTI